ncbi:MAG: T9SS type A sorting domain-containing protein, partial [Candidatus Marinimicrobia bacterium]|nr:T9SS type A sorting domain-containing protein [Candidatus Neomarinimicrobiota bacterium]
FNPTTTIEFSIPYSSFVTVKIYDITGKEITTLLNDNLPVGYHSVTWDSNNSSGLYFIRMESGEFIQTRKVVLVK